MEIRADIKTKIFWSIIILLIVWCLLVRPELNIYKLRNYGQQINGVIYQKKGVGSKGTIRCFYNFMVDDLIYEGFYDNDKYNKGDSLEIIYYKKDPRLNQAKQFVEDY